MSSNLAFGFLGNWIRGLVKEYSGCIVKSFFGGWVWGGFGGGLLGTLRRHRNPYFGKVVRLQCVALQRYNQQLWVNDSQALKELHTAQFRIFLTTRARK